MSLSSHWHNDTRLSGGNDPNSRSIITTKEINNANRKWWAGSWGHDLWNWHVGRRHYWPVKENRWKKAILHMHNVCHVQLKFRIKASKKRLPEKEKKSPTNYLSFSRVLKGNVIVSSQWEDSLRSSKWDQFHSPWVWFLWSLVLQSVWTQL